MCVCARTHVCFLRSKELVVAQDLLAHGEEDNSTFLEGLC